jgi:hypothetical protein
MDNLEKLATQGTQDEEKPSKNTTQYALNTAMRKPTQTRQTTEGKNEPNIEEIVPDITTQKSERKYT